MKTPPFFAIILVFLALILSGCSGAEETVIEINPLPRPATAARLEPTPSPVPSGALSAANNFLNWYLKYDVDENGFPLAPFEQGGHRACRCVTPEYLARIDAEVRVDTTQRGVFDPVTGGFGMVDSTSTRLFDSDGPYATVIAELEAIDWARQVTIDLVFSEERWLVDNIRGASIATPEGVTQLFYDWYLDYYRSHGDPLADGAYKSSPYLSDAYINWVNGVQISFDNDGFDPFVMSRAIPFGASIMDAQVSGDQATVWVNRFLVTPQFNPLLVHLEQQGIYWKIVDVTMEEGPASPAEVVEAFYEWYLEYSGSVSPAGRNALVDGAYQGSPFLTIAFVENVDQTLKSMQFGGFDPFVCAQIIPEQITTDGIFVADMYGPDYENKASVVVRTEFAGHVFTVDLVRSDREQDWQIDNIVCSGTPAGIVKAFYTWYQGCLEEGPYCRPPDQDYSSSGFVTVDFVDRVETLRAELRAADVSAVNPITLSQSDIPAFGLETLSESEDRAQVLLTNLAWAEHVLSIELVNDGSALKIDNIELYVPNTPEAVTRAIIGQYSAVRRSPQDPYALYVYDPDQHLTLEFGQKVEAYLRAGMPAGEDPLLLSDRIPYHVEIQSIEAGETQAEIIAILHDTGDEPFYLTVELVVVEGMWKISGVR
jgi:hypothetical protein